MLSLLWRKPNRHYYDKYSIKPSFYFLVVIRTAEPWSYGIYIFWVVFSPQFHWLI